MSFSITTIMEMDEQSTIIQPEEAPSKYWVKI